MPTSQNYRDLFRHPSTVDKLNFFQSLMNAKDLISDLALALIIVIRAELEKPEQQSPAAYRRYAEVIEALCRQMPEIYEQVAEAWRQRRPVPLVRPPGSLQQEPRLSEAGEATSLALSVE